MARRGRYFDMEALTEPVGFGKYEFESLLWIIENDIDYLTWMYADYGMKCSKALNAFINEMLNNKYVADSQLEYLYYKYSVQENEEKIAKEREKEERKAAKEAERVSASLNNKLNLLNTLVQNEHEQKKQAQEEWIGYVIKYFDSCRMEEDTESGKLKWTVEEKKASEVKKKTIYRCDTLMGTIFVLEEMILKEDGKWSVKMAFLSSDKRSKYYITKNNRGSAQNLRNQIKKLCK